MGAVSQWGDDAHDFPDKGGQLPCHGDLHLLPCLAAGGELAPAFMESVLAAPGDLDDLTSMGFGDGLLSGGEFLADLRGQTVVLGALIRSPPHGSLTPAGQPAAVCLGPRRGPRLVEDPAQVTIAAFGDRPLSSASSAAAFTRHEPEVGHELAWMGEAVDIADLTHPPPHGGFALRASLRSVYLAPLGSLTVIMVATV